MAFASYPFIGGGGVPIYSTFSAFPAGTTAGDLAVAADTGVLYEWNGSAWQVVGGPGVPLSLGAFGSTPNADGASITANVLTLQPADNTHPGGVSTLAQTFAGVKTFSSAPNFSSLTAGYALVLDGSNNVASLQYTPANVGSTLIQRDSQGNSIQNNSVSQSTTIVSSGQTIAMSSATSRIQKITGSANVTFTLPNATSLTPSGWTFEFVVNTTGTITINNFGNTLITTAVAGSSLYLVCTDNSTSNGVWDAHWLAPSATIWGTAGLTLGGSSTLTVPGTTTLSALGSGLVRASSLGVLSSAELSSDVTTSGTNATTVAKIQGTTVSGTTGSTNVVFSSGPTMTNPIVGTQSQLDGSTKAASTAYVDTAVANAVAGLNPAVAVQAATTAAADTSGFTYNNGVSGIGATFTGSVNTAVTIDGYTFTTPGQRLLVKNDTQSGNPGAYNGVYYVTQIQTLGLPPIFTRALDYDTPSDINNTGAIPVVNGTVNGTTSWVQTAQVVTVGTTPLVFVKFSRNPADYLLAANNLSDVASKSTSFNNLSPMTTSGDIIYGGASGTGTRLDANATATNKYLQSVSSGTPSWQQVAFTDISGTLSPTAGGTGLSNPTAHNLLVAEGSSNMTLLAPMAGTVLVATSSSADPSFSATPTLGVNGTTTGQLNLATSAGSGQSITVQNRAGTTAYNFNLPNTAGTAGFLLTSQGGGSSDMTWTPAASGGTKNYLGTVNNVNTNGNFELNSLSGWNWCNAGTLTNAIPTGTPNFTSVNSNPLYSFTITTSSTCAVGDTYTNNTQTFTVVTALASQSGTVFFATGTGDPTASGNLSRATGSGTSTIAYTAFTKETMSIVSSGQLAGSYSMSLAISAATVAGLGFCSNAVTIDAEDQAKVLTFKFYYSANTNPGNANWSGTSSNSFGIAVYDVTNSSWLSSTANFGMTQSSGIGYVTGTCQTNLTTASIRFVVYNANATTGAVTLYFDDLFLGPQTAPIGPVMTDWVSFTPTGSWVTNTTYTGKWRRIGDSMMVQTQINLSGAPTGTLAAINIPSGYTIDTTKMAGTPNGASAVFGTWSGVAASSNVTGQVEYNNTTSVTVYYQSATTGAQSVINATAPLTWANTNTMYLTYVIPIVGWSSNLNMSSDTDTRVVSVASNSNQVPTGTISSSYSVAVFGSVASDTHGAYNTSTGLYTVPVTGYYAVTATIDVSHTSVAVNNSLQVAARKNGATVYGTGISKVSSTSVTEFAASTASVILCNAGDTIGIVVLSTGNTPVYSNANIGSSFAINRLSGPAVIAATESVNMSYVGYSSGITGTSNATVTYTTKIKDSHNGYSSGTYTVPVTGTYQVEAGILLTTTGTPTVGTTIADLQIIQAGSNTTTFEQKYYVPTTNTTIASAGFPLAASGIMYCQAGDTIKVQASVNLATAGAAASNTMNYFCLARLGN